MRPTTFTDYSLRTLIYLALDETRLATIPGVATAFGISSNHLMKVVNRLARAGVIDSRRGKGGGIRLARLPEEINLGQIVRICEGGYPAAECLLANSDECCIAPACRLGKIFGRAFDAFNAVLDEYTLADLIANRDALKRILF